MPIDFVCPACGKKFPRELKMIMPHIEEHVIDEIKKAHPHWVQTQGVCKKCYEYLKKQLPSWKSKKEG